MKRTIITREIKYIEIIKRTRKYIWIKYLSQLKDRAHHLKYIKIIKKINKYKDQIFITTEG
jgi:hypothetical protein